MFFWFSYLFYDPMDVGSLISGSSAFSKSSLNIWKFMIHVLLKPCLENFEHYFASVWDVCNCIVGRTFLGIAFLWDWNENWPFHCGPAGKESACDAGDLGSILGLGRSPGEGKCYPLQYSGLENSMDCIVYGVAKSRTQLSDFHFTSLHFF